MNAEGAITKKGGHDNIRKCTAIHVIAKNGTTTGTWYCSETLVKKSFCHGNPISPILFPGVLFFPLF
jgi:hypothetical protein